MPIEIPPLKPSTRTNDYPIANIGPPSRTTSAYVISSLLQPPRRNARPLSTVRLSLDQHAQPWFLNALGWDTIDDQSFRKPSQRLTDVDRRTDGMMDDELPRQNGKTSHRRPPTAKGKKRQIDDEYHSGDESGDEDEEEEGEWFGQSFSRRGSTRNSYREQMRAQKLDFLRNSHPHYHDLPSSELLKTILHSTTHYYTSQSPPLLDEIGYNNYLAHVARLARHANKQTRRRRRLRKRQFAQGDARFGQDGQDDEDYDTPSSSSSSSAESYSSSRTSSSASSLSDSSSSSRSARTSKTRRRTISQSTIAETSQSRSNSSNRPSFPTPSTSNTTKPAKPTPRTQSKSVSTDDCDSRMSGTRGKKPRLASGMKKVILKSSVDRKRHKSRRTRWRAVSKTDMHKSLDGDSLIALGVLLEEHIRHQVLTRYYNSYASALSPTPEPIEFSSPSLSLSGEDQNWSEEKSKERPEAEEGNTTGTESANSDVFDMRDSDTE